MKYTIVLNLKMDCPERTKEYLINRGFEIFVVGRYTGVRKKIKAANTPFVTSEDSFLHCIANVDGLDCDILTIMSNPEVINSHIESQR